MESSSHSSNDDLDLAGTAVEPQTPVKSSRFAVQPVVEIAKAPIATEPQVGVPDGPEERVKLDVGDDEDEKSDEDDDDLIVGMSFRKRAASSASQLTQSDLSRLGMLTAISGDGGSLFGSSVLLSSPSYLSVSRELRRALSKEADGEIATSMEYLDTIMENAEYVDTIKGKLPLAEAAKMIAQDRSKREELFTESHVHKFKVQCYKRLICIGFGFCCIFASFFCLRGLQSSNSGDDPMLGLLTFACLTVLTWLGDLLSIQVIYYIRPKWCLVISSVPFILYAAANFYPSPFTLIPSALLTGVGIGMMWSSEGIYMINLAANYAMVSRKSLLEVIGKFNSVIFGMHMISGFIGNILGYAILSTGKDHSVGENFSVNNSLNENSTAVCGLDFYSSDQVARPLDEVDPGRKMILIAVVTGLAVIGCVNFIVFLRPLKTVKVTGNNNIIKIFSSFLRMFTKVEMWLLVPLMLFPGIGNSLMVADFTKAYIACAYGLNYVSLLMMVGGIFSMIGAMVSGRIVYKVGRIPVFIFGTAAYVASAMTALLWQPVEGHVTVMVFIPVSLYFLGFGILMTQVNGFLGEVYRTELVNALCMFHVFKGFSEGLTTLASAFKWMNLQHKIILSIVELVVAVALFIVVDVLHKRKKTS